MHRIRYLQSITSYITTAVVLDLPFWRFDGTIDKIFVGGMVFTAGYYLAEKVIKKERTAGKHRALSKITNYIVTDI